MPRLLAVDLMPLLYRGHFAMAKRPRMTSKGFNSSALHFFASTLASLVSRPGATHAALVMDSGPTFRHALYPQYKATRDKMPEDIAASIAPAREFAAAMRIPVLSADGFEADDVAGTLAALADAAGWEAWIVSPDKDMAQLVTDRVSLVRPSHVPGEKDDVYDPARVRDECSVPEPAAMVDWLGMAGDAADNIPGFPGIGPKKASELIARFGFLEGVIAHVSEIPGKTGAAIAENAGVARLSRRLAEIRRDVPLGVSLDDLAIKPFDAAALEALFSRFEMFALSKRILSSAGSKAAPSSPAAQPAAAPEEPAPVAALRPAPPVELLEAAAPDSVAALAAELEAAPRFAFSAGDGWLRVSAVPGREWLVRCSGPAAEPAPAAPEPPPADDLFSFFAAQAPSPPPAPQTAAAPDHAAGSLPAAVLRAFADPSKTKVGHDLKPSLRALRRMGVEVAGPFEDTMLAHCVLDPARRHFLDAVVREVLGEETAPAPAAGEDSAASRAGSVSAVLRLAPALSSRVDAAGAARAWREAENPLVPVLLDMEDAGVRVDSAALSRLSVSLGAELSAIGARIHALVGEPFNIDSPKQLGSVLFERLGLPGGTKTARGFYSTAEEVLQGLVGEHPVVREVLEWRAVSKLKSTYVDKLPQCVDPRDGRIHTTFQQAVAETGRLSSDNPNLQNVPVRTERGKPIRAAFVAEPGCRLVSADYSQVELRVMASLSGDEALLEAFRRDEDIHAATAARVFGIDQSEVTREQRSRCKQVSFGIIYGISAFGLSQRLGMPRPEADALIKTWFEAHPGVKRWIEATKARAREEGFVSTLLGRRRPLRDISSRNAAVRSAAERVAVNTPVQGTAADIAKLAMVRVHAALRERGLAARLVLQVHDELLLEAPEAEVPEVSALVREAMENALPLAVPLKVDVGTGSNWLEAH